tara:strand:+ start:99 stop:287 length:189 start_codon:yes stop_codon:yes gene_type:complete
VIEKLFALTHGYGIDLTIIDVALDDDLLSRYGEYIPVLEIEDKVLRSPFNEEKMRLFLEKLD